MEFRDILRLHEIIEAGHRVLNPIDETMLATLGASLRLVPDARILDLACGKGELLATWAAAHATRGVGVDISEVFSSAARERAAELGVADRMEVITADAADCVPGAAGAPEGTFDVVSCLGATWIGGGLAGTLDLMSRWLAPGGLLLVGEPYWNEPPGPHALAATDTRADEYGSLEAMLGSFDARGLDLVEMMLATPGSWDRYVAPQWLAARRWLDANPGDPFSPTVREHLRRSPLDHVRYQRGLLGWGVFALMPR